MLSSNLEEQKALNKKMLMAILQNIQFLGRQGLALRGHNEKESNFLQLMKLRSLDLPVRACLQIMNCYAHCL